MPPFDAPEAEPIDVRGSRAEGLESVTWVLPPAASSVRRARRQVGVQLDVWGLFGLVGDAELIISELVTNAICHGSQTEPVWHTVRRMRTQAGEAVRLEVGDGGGRWRGGIPRPREGGALDADAGGLPCSGRGLRLVEALSCSWGVWRLPHGHLVWAVLPVVSGPGDGAA